MAFTIDSPNPVLDTLVSFNSVKVLTYMRYVFGRYTYSGICYLDDDSSV